MLRGGAKLTTLVRLWLLTDADVVTTGIAGTGVYILSWTMKNFGMQEQIVAMYGRLCNTCHQFVGILRAMDKDSMVTVGLLSIID